MAGGRVWTVEEANAALPSVRPTVERIRDLVVAARREREEAAPRRQGNGQAWTPSGVSELRAAVEELTGSGIVLRDPEAGLIDFPARLPDGREYLLCWVLGEPEVAWWHWPETGFAGRRRLSDPPG